MSGLTLSRRERASRPRVTLALFPSLGTTHRIWRRLLDVLATKSEMDVLLFDLPGHGAAPRSPGVAMTDLVADAAGMMDSERRTGPLLVAGVSMGGAIAVESARLRPREVNGVIAFNSGLRLGSPEGWAALIDRVASARNAASDPAGTRDGWFTPSFAGGPGVAVCERLLEELAEVDPDSYIACCRALARYDAEGAAGLERLWGLAVGGAADRATPATGMRELAGAAPGLEYVELPGAHLAIVENASAAAALVDRAVRAVLSDGRSAA